MKSQTISASLIYYTPGPFGPLQHSNGSRHFTRDELAESVRNVDSILKRKGAQHIVLDTDAGLAVQVSGYNGYRGMYVDVISREELAPYLT